MSRRGGEGASIARTFAWLGVLCCVVSALLVIAGAVTVLHRSERCVQQVLAAQDAGLSTWEAVERCQR